VKSESRIGLIRFWRRSLAEPCGSVYRVFAGRPIWARKQS
jgi:hypothetical protein